MKQVLRYIVLALIFSNLLAVISTNQRQNLHWGYNEGRRYDFVIEDYVNLNGTVTQHSEYLHSIAPSYPEIPEFISSIDSIPRVSFGLFFENGSYAEERGLAVPIGNWSVFTAIIVNYALETNLSIHIIDTELEWGYNATLLAYGDYIFSTIITYSKEDGVINEQTWDDRVGNYFHSRDSIRRIPMSPVVQNLIISSIVGIIIVGVIITLSGFRGSSIQRRTVKLTVLSSQMRMTGRSSGRFRLLSIDS